MVALPAAARLLLAIETVEAEPPTSALFRRAEAEALGALLVAELEEVLEPPEAFGIAIMAAAYDAAQVLRPGFPLHAEIERLLRALPEPRTVLTLRGLRGRAPTPVLMPDRALMGGSLLFLPFCLLAESDRLAPVRDRLEQELAGRGPVAARLALTLQRALGRRIGHARLITLADLCASTALHLQTAGMGPLWSVLEMALFGDRGPAWWTLPGGLSVGMDADAQASVHFLTLPAHAIRHGRGGYPAYLLSLRQALALFEAHGLRLAVELSGDGHLEVDSEARYVIDWVDAGQAVARALARVTDELGIVQIELVSDTGRPVACCYPLRQGALPALRRRLEDCLPGGLRPEFVAFQDSPGTG